MMMMIMTRMMRHSRVVIENALTQRMVMVRWEVCCKYCDSNRLENCSLGEEAVVILIVNNCKSLGWNIVNMCIGWYIVDMYIVDTCYLI